MAGLASQLEPGQGPQARLGGWSWESGPQGECQIQQKWGESGFRRRWGTGALDTLGWGSQGGIFQGLAWLQASPLDRDLFEPVSKGL